jgi:hypothetical protein
VFVIAGSSHAVALEPAISAVDRGQPGPG